jgi:membrane associated rhomboid family serine protease
MQQPWSGWAILLTINVVVFLLQVLIDPPSLATHMAMFEKSFVGQWLALDSSQISWLLPMQLFTYQFLHGGVWHLLMNGLGLFFIGRALEPSIGRQEIIGLYLVSGVVGALFQLGFAAVFPAQFAGPMVGASAGVFGFMGVLARLFPYREVYLLLFFVLPIRLKLHWVFWGSFAIAMVSILAAIRTEAGDSVAHAAHLGGLLYGAFYVAKLVRNGGFMRFLPGMPGMPRIRFVSDGSPKGSAATHRRNWRKPRVVDAAEVAEGDFMSREVNPILDKISEQGIQSLSERERKILDKARSKM